MLGMFYAWMRLCCTGSRHPVLPVVSQNQKSQHHFKQTVICGFLKQRNLKKNLEELLLSIRTIYSFGNVSAVKEGCPGGSGSNGSLAVHASPLSASPWHAFGAGACEVGWLVSSAGWMKSCSACAAAHQGGTFVLWNCMHGLNAVGCQCKSRESVWVISPEQELWWRAPEARRGQSCAEWVCSEQPLWGELSPRVPWEE